MIRGFFAAALAQALLALLVLPAPSAACTLCPPPVDPLRMLAASSDTVPGASTVLRASSALDVEPLPVEAGSPGSLERPPPAAEGFGPKFRRAWLPITCGELALLGITAALPKSWTGWSATFVQDGADNLGEAWTKPPVMDDDGWFHNYVGHPYGGSVYYNSVRSQGATVPESFLTNLVLSTQWEYIFEAVAERPSIQDLVITPVVGSVLGELIHRTTTRLRRNGTTTFEKVFIAVLNPAGAILGGD
ncbi:MAG TPA: DUF3943 domain-containing protein [Candidatus Eisenbacteria bacterium]|nr:DUF3943 domain-containing protein [Candidatus Eisenbacteria bacterium]